MTRTLGGKAVAATIRSEVRAGVGDLVGAGVPVRLDVVLVGDDPASVTYVAMKERDCAEVGIESKVHRYGSDVTQEELAALMVTDILARGTTLLVAGDHGPVLRAFGRDADDGVVELPGVMSRKKQVAPQVLQAF